MNSKWLICLHIAVVALSCRQHHGSSSPGFSTESPQSGISPTPPGPSQPVYEFSQKICAEGLLKYQLPPAHERPAIVIENSDQSVWKSLTFGDEIWEADSTFLPMAYHDDHYLLVLRISGIDDNRYEVVVNEETDETKFIPKTNPSFIRTTWEEHLTQDLFAVGFDPVLNPVKADTSILAQSYTFQSEATYHPVSIQGDWLQIKWELDGVIYNGYIIWQKQGRLQVYLYYFA